MRWIITRKFDDTDEINMYHFHGDISDVHEMMMQMIKKDKEDESLGEWYEGTESAGYIYNFTNDGLSGFNRYQYFSIIYYAKPEEQIKTVYLE